MIIRYTFICLIHTYEHLDEFAYQKQTNIILDCIFFIRNKIIYKNNRVRSGKDVNVRTVMHKNDQSFSQQLANIAICL